MMEKMKSNSEQGDVDLSVLRTPIPTSVTGFVGVMKAYGEGTKEVQRILENECDIIYECRVCRNIFRDIANLMTHKRLFCKAAFNSKRDFHFPDNGFIDQNISSVIEQERRILNIESRREKSSADPLLTKDLGGLVQKMRMKQVVSGTLKPSDYYELVTSKVTLEDVMQRNHLLHLEQIPETSVAVYQTVNLDNGLEDGSVPALKGDATMKREVEEVNKLATNKDTVVGPDGRALKLAEFRETVTKDDFEIDNLEELLMLCHFDFDADTEPHECAICEARFDTEKTLLLHIKLKHISSTKVYQCPSCSQTFLQAALVIKHLSNDHKKSTKKIRSMRETIHKRHIRIDEVQIKGPSRELNRLQVEKEKIEAENQKAYLDNMANFDNTNQSMCMYCKKIFERKAVLTSHMVTCRNKFEKMLMGGGGGAGQPTSASAVASSSAPSGAKRGPKPGAGQSQKENGTKEKELTHDENSSSTVISSDGGGSNDGGEVLAAPDGDNSNGSAKRKRKLGGGGASKPIVIKKVKKEHSKVSELMEKEIWNAAHEDRDDAFFSFDEKAPEDARDETYKRRFGCEICSKNFSTLSNLKRHNVMFHYFKSRYQCKLCDYRAMKKKEAMVHLREKHQLDKEEHEMKMYIEQEKNEVSSSEVLELDLDDGCSNQERSTGGRDNSGTNSPVSIVSVTSATTTPNSMTNGVVSGSSSSSVLTTPPTDTPSAPRKRGRPKGSFKVKSTKPVPLPDRGLRADSKRTVEAGSADISAFTEVKKKVVVPSIPAPPPAPLLTESPSFNSAVASVAAAAAPSRPIRNRTKPKDKDFVYDLSSLKEDFIYEDEAMDTAMAESILAATSTPNSNSSSSLNGPPVVAAVAPVLPASSSSEAPNKIAKKRSSLAERLLTNGESSDGPNQVTLVKRGVGRPPKLKTYSKESFRRDSPVENGEDSEVEVKNAALKMAQSEVHKSSATLKPSPRPINWAKNVMIPTRIIEHRHSIDRPKVFDLRKEDVRRNSVEIMMTKGNVKENNRPVCSPNGNIMEPRAFHRGAGEAIKDYTRITDRGLGGGGGSASVARQSVPEAELRPPAENPILLNGRSLEEIITMSEISMEDGEQEEG